MENPRSWRTAFLRTLITIGIVIGSLFLSEIPSYAATQITATVCEGTLCPTIPGAISALSTGSSQTRLIGITATPNSTYALYAFGGVICTHNGTATRSGGSWHVDAGDSLTSATKNGDGVTASETINTTSTYTLGSNYYACPATGGPWVINGLKIFWRLNSSPFSETDGFYTIGSAAAVCSSSAYSDATGSYVGTTLSVRFKFTATSLPSGGWNVIAPDPGNNNGTPTGVVATTDTVDGYAGYYGKSFTLSTLSTLTARIWANDPSDAFTGCYISITLSTNQIASTPVVGQGGNDGTDNTQTTNCLLSLNPVHWIKCLFWPQSSFQQWNDLNTTFKTHAPTSLVIGGITYVSDIKGYLDGVNPDCTGTYGNSCVQENTFQAPDTCNQSEGQTGTTNPTCGQNIDFLAAAGNLMQTNTGGTFLYTIMQTGIVVTGFLMSWSLISRSIGSKE